MFHRHIDLFTKQTFRALFGIFLLILSFGVAKAQQTTTSVTDGSTPSGLAPGSPAGSYALSGFDNVSLYNGNLNFHLPLLQIGGRGSAQTISTLALNVKSWHVSHFHKELPDGNVLDSFKPTQLGWRPYSDYGAGRLTGRNYGLQTSSNLSCTWYGKTLSRLTFSMPDGTELELRDQPTNGQPLVSLCNQGANRGKVFVTADGTAATFISDADIVDNPAINIAGPHGFSVSGYLMLRDGTRYRIDVGNVTWLRDRNGNMLRFAYTSTSMVITDSLNRTVTVNYNVSDVTPYGLCDQIIYTGFGGAQRIIRVSHTSLQNVLRSGYAIKTLGNTGGLFPELTGGSPSTTYNPTDMTSAVWLPDGRSYKFYYNSYGELARVELPTGGAVEYDMTPDSGVICAGSGCSDTEAERQIYRRVIERRVYPNGSSGTTYELKDVYANSEAIGTNSSIVTAESTASNGTVSAVISRSRHYFDGSALNSLFTGGSSGYGPWYEGHERQTDQLDTAGSIETATVLRRAVNTWAQQAHISWWTGYGPQSEEAPNNPRLIETLTTIEPSGANLVSKSTAVDPNDPTGQTFGFDQFNNPTDVWEYDFGNTFLRRVHTDYVTSSSYINANVDPTLGAHLRSLPSQRWISSDSSGLNKVHLTQYEYDIYSTDSRHAALTNRNSITGLCLTYDLAGTCVKLSDQNYAIRGNVTSATSYANASAMTGPVTLSKQYDIAGNVVANIDALGNQVTLGYADSFCNGSTCGGTFSANTYAFVTSTTSPIPDPTGQHGSASAFTMTSVFDFGTGHVTSATDANNQIINLDYNDPLDRIKAIIRPAGGGRTDYEYGDTVGNLYLRTRMDLDSSRKTDTYQFFDGFGRTTESRLMENGGQYVSTKQVPFTILQDPDNGAWLKVTQVSNPFRPTLEQPVWTTSFVDGLGRPIKVRTPDNAIVRTSYSGNAVTVTDQAGRQRRSLTDSIGRIVRIDEPDKDTGDLGSVATPVQATYYDYDLLGNLLHVTQGTQPQRSFSYDSLSRLVTAFNPESGTVSYQYDVNGNLKQKTDARSITIFYEYDKLNRNISINYSNTTIGSPDSPDIEIFYDGAIKGKGRWWKSYAGGNETVGNNVDATSIDEYDALGRPLTETQRFKLNGTWSTNTYQVTRQYNLAGSVILQNYPSGHSVAYNYDDAGRLGDNGQNLAFTGTLGDGTLRTYSRGITYAPAGQLNQEQFGTNTAVYNKLNYNSRLQLAEILVSTTGGDTSWNRGKILNQHSLQCEGVTCNATDNNGNLRKQEVDIPNDQGALAASWSQQYDYDQLNRLKRVHEYTGNSALDWQQEFDYDRWGNRMINATNTWIGTSSNPPSALLNETQFDTGNLASTNRLYAPGDLALADNQRRMRYDAAGNLIFDSYLGAGDRVYDAADHMTQAWGGNNQWQYYTYNANGQRTRRKIDNQETWQIYGMDGELVAEYPANGASTSPQKEYGYRNGQLLITAAPSTGQRVNFALANGSYPYATASSSASLSFTPNATNNGDRKGLHWGFGPLTGSGWQDVTSNTYPDWVQIDFNVSRTIDEIDVFTIQDNWTDPVEPTESMTFTTQGITAFDVQYWNGSTWVTVPGGSITGNNKVWRKVTFSPVNTTMIRVVVNAALDNFSRIVEIEAWGTTGGGSAEVNWLVSDQLDTPRMIIDATGSLAGMKRHDYLPFGEDLVALGLRTTTLGYAGDNTRQKFTQQERDNEISLDYFNARYYSAPQGRFTTPDPFGGSGFVGVPQSWNKYAYCLNRPFVFNDPSGEIWLTTDDRTFIWIDDDDYEKHKEQYKNYSVANGAVTQYQRSVNCPQCAGISYGQWVELNADGTVSPTTNPTTYIYPVYTDEEIKSPVPVITGTVRESYINPDMYGPKGGSRTFTTKSGRTERWYDSNGRAVCDIDYGHDHGAGDPHVHWWDWTPQVPQRGDGERIQPEWDWTTWDNGDKSVNPFRRRPSTGTGPNSIPVTPMDIPTSIPVRPVVPLRPMVPLRPILVP